MLKNYYKTLNVDILATQTDIKRSYRNLAKQYHPDKNPDNPDAAIMFQEVREAYEVLSDPDERKRYDANFKYLKVVPTKSEPEQVIAKPKLKRNIIATAIVLVIASLVLILEYAYLKDFNNTLKPDMTVEQVIELYGTPSERMENELKYDKAIIYFINGKVAYWYNAYDDIDIKNSKINDIKKIELGSPIEDIFHAYGYPDTYAKTFLVYHNIVIMYKNNIVTDVYYLES